MTVDMKEKKESIRKFKERFSKEQKEISYEDFDRYFYVDNFFYSAKIPYENEKYYELLSEMISNILKGYLQELEYYINLKPSTIQTSSDVEILSKESEIITKHYLELHISYKKFHQLYLDNKRNKSEINEYLKESYKKIKEFNIYSSKLQTKFIKNLEKKLKDINKKEEVRHDSSIFH